MDFVLLNIQIGSKRKEKILWKERLLRELLYTMKLCKSSFWMCPDCETAELSMELPLFPMLSILAPAVGHCWR